MKHFYYLCLKRDLAEGKYRCIKVSDGLIATLKQGVPVVGLNKCAHRGFKVAEEHGNLPIKCPYHGRAYNFEKTFDTDQFGEFIFVVKDEIGIFEVACSNFGDALGAEFGSYAQTVDAPFYLWMQNTADPNHLRSIHKSGFAELFEGVKPQDVVIKYNYSSYTMPIKENIVRKYEKAICPIEDHTFFHAMIGPNLSITSFLGLFYSVEAANHIDDYTTHVETRFFVGKNSKVPMLIRQSALQSNIKVLREDKAAVEKWAETFDIRDSPEWLPGEERIQAYIKMIHQMGIYPEHPYDTGS